MSFQAKDKSHWQKLFSHFCSRAANEEEEIAHKLLGEKFRVSYRHVTSARNMKLLNCKTDRKSGGSKTTSCSCATRGFFTAARAKRDMSYSLLTGFNSHVCLWCVFCYVKIIVPSLTLFLQGQLALLHSLFKTALYDDHLNRVSKNNSHVSSRFLVRSSIRHVTAVASQPTRIFIIESNKGYFPCVTFWEMCFTALLPRVKWGDWCHSDVCVWVKCEAAGYISLE